MGESSKRSYFMQTARLGFGLWTEDDQPLALQLWGDADVTSLIGGPFSEDQVSHRLDIEIYNMKYFAFQYWPIFLLTSNEFVGAAGLKWHEREKSTYELGYYLIPSYWGRGFASEAASAVTDHAFAVLKASGLFGGHHPRNVPSGIVLQKIGFRLTHTELYPPTQLQHPSYWMDPPKGSHGSSEETDDVFYK